MELIYKLGHRTTDRKEKNWDNRSKINLCSYWLKLSIICEQQYNYYIMAMPREPWP